MTAAIVDVGHVVTVHALAVGDIELARFAAQTAYVAAPYDETARLDLIEVDHALGHHDEAERALRDGVLSRSDDGLGPIDMPPRSATSRWLRRHCTTLGLSSIYPLGCRSGRALISTADVPSSTRASPSPRGSAPRFEKGADASHPNYLAYEEQRPGSVAAHHVVRATQYWAQGTSVGDRKD
jgi:hypothetical protein